MLHVLGALHGALASQPALVHLRVSESIIQPVAFHGCLDQYMQLPAAQYVAVPMPLSGSLARVPDTADLFSLVVPPVRFGAPAGLDPPVPGSFHPCCPACCLSC